MNIGFDEQVAIVTGAGNGLGRSYALELARRGAKVVVNDLGGKHDGSGQDPEVSRRVADEINRSGGVAIANASSITTDAGAQALATQALDAFGRIDILIANAGIHRSAPFAVSKADWDAFAAKYSPDLVAPGVVYLASRDAPTGVILTAGGGVFACAQMLGARGVNLGKHADADSVAKRWSTISDFSAPVSFQKALDHGHWLDEMIAAGTAAPG